MVQKSVLTQVPISELKKILEKQTISMNGEIISKKGNSTFWNTQYGKSIIEIESKIKQTPNGNKITLIGRSLDNKIQGEGFVINKFIKSISEKIEIEEIKNKSTEKNKTKAKPSVVTQSNKSYFKPYILVIVVVGFLWFLTNNLEDSSTNTRTTKQGFKGSYDKESLEKLVEYSLNKDYQSINYLLQSGEVFELPAGQEAYILKSEFPGKVKIQIKGDTNEIWTFIEAIKE